MLTDSIHITYFLQIEINSKIMKLVKAKISVGTHDENINFIFDKKFQ